MGNAGSILACLTMAAALVACSSSSPSPYATPSDAGQGDQRSCSLGGPFHVTFAPTADSPPACSCSKCSYSVASGHVGDIVSLASANIEYFLAPLLSVDIFAPISTCGSDKTSACSYEGTCMYPSSPMYPSGPLSSTFTFTVTNGAASGTQSFIVPATDGGSAMTCTYEVTASPAAD